MWDFYGVVWLIGCKIHVVWVSWISVCCNKVTTRGSCKDGVCSLNALDCESVVSNWSWVEVMWVTEGRKEALKFSLGVNK